MVSILFYDRESEQIIALCRTLSKGEILAGLGFSEGKLMDSLEVIETTAKKTEQVGL